MVKPNAVAVAGIRLQRVVRILLKRIGLPGLLQAFESGT